MNWLTFIKYSGHIMYINVIELKQFYVVINREETLLPSMTDSTNFGF